MGLWNGRLKRIGRCPGATRLGAHQRRLAVCVGLAVLLTAGVVSTASAEAQEVGALTVTVTGARNAEGRVGVAVFANREGFPEDMSSAVEAEWVEIDPETFTAQVTFRNLPPGAYSVAVLHDENENERLDRNFLGIPREGYGASNNVARRRRTPSFDDAQFSFDGDSLAIEIALLY